MFGEVGGVLTASKKKHREKTNYTSFYEDLLEELGDTLWYFTSICLKKGIEKKVLVDWYNNPAQEVNQSLDSALIDLAIYASDIVKSVSNNNYINAFERFCSQFLIVLKLEGIPIDQIIKSNYEKISGRFIKPSFENLPTFDDGFEPDERLPDKFEISIFQKQSGKSYLRWNCIPSAQVGQIRLID